MTKIKYSEEIKSMSGMNDEFFNALMQDNYEGAQLLLRIVMRDDTLVLVKDPDTQKYIKNLGKKSIRLDMYAEDKDKHYDVEIQRADKGAGAHRARYYSSLLDADITVPGEDYESIPDTYVIFITENDLAGDGKPYHEVQRISDTGKPFNDGSHILYVNGQYRGADDFGTLMHDLHCVDPHQIELKPLRDRAIFLKETEEGMEHMSEQMERIVQRERNEAATLATMNTKKDTALEMLRDGVLSVEKIAQYSNLTVAEVKELQKSLMN